MDGDFDPSAPSIRKALHVRFYQSIKSIGLSSRIIGTYRTILLIASTQLMRRLWLGPSTGGNQPRRSLSDTFSRDAIYDTLEDLLPRRQTHSPSYCAWKLLRSFGVDILFRIVFLLYYHITIHTILGTVLPHQRSSAMIKAFSGHFNFLFSICLLSGSPRG